MSTGAFTLTAPEGGEIGVPGDEDLIRAWDEFCAVWREIDRYNSRRRGRYPTQMDVELLKREQATWNRYLDLEGVSRAAGPSCSGEMP